MNVILIIVLVVVLPMTTSYTMYDAEKGQCSIIDGGWSEWTLGACSVTCGEGHQKRFRHCNAPVPKHGGKICEGESVEVKQCEAQHKCPIDGEWSPWNDGGECSKLCGGGHITFTRRCDNPIPRHCGKPCVGENIRTKACNTNHCKVDGGWSGWECGNCFIHKRERTCVKRCSRSCSQPLPQHGGKSCDGKTKGYFPCDKRECPETDVHGSCEACHSKAIQYEKENDKIGFVGHACRANWKNCEDRNGGIKKMYPANHWFFLHCSADGPWCKPCATRSLVYNPTCGQCEATANGPCTGPMEWRNEKIIDLDMIDEENYWK